VLLFAQDGYDLLEGLGLNRDTVNTEHAVIRYANTSIHPVVDESDTLTLVIDNNTAPSAQITIDVYFALGY